MATIDELGMIFGAQYYRYPFPDETCWVQDMANMKALGFNAVKLWAVWNHIEPVRGQYHFAELDRLMELAMQNGLRVVVNIIPEGAPAWLYVGNEDALYQTADGRKVTTGGPANLPSGGWPGLCMDKPEAAEMVSDFIRAVAAHLAAHPAMLALDVWNEPHLEPMFDYRGDMLCYCQHSVVQFRTWLKEKYGTLDKLNEAWFRTYQDWCEIVPPPRLGTWADMMDWRLFWLLNMQRWMALKVSAAKEGAPNLLVQSHVAYSGYVGTCGAGGLANELGDEFLLARKTDIFGLTCFPKWLMRADPYFNHMINNEIVAAAAYDKPFYQVELQGGGGKAGLLGGEIPSAADVRYWNYATVAAGGKGVMYWQYAPEPAGIESPGFGLTGFLHENTARSLEAGCCAQELNQPLLCRAKRVPAQNAIYLSRTNSTWFYSAGREEQKYAHAIHGAYAIAYQHGIPMTFAHQDRVESLYEDGVRTLILPMPMVLSTEETDALERFVRAGGTLISEGFPGLYSEGGKLDAHCRALSRLWGLKHVEVQKLSEEALCQNAAFDGCLYRQLVEAEDCARVISTYQDGAPALTERKLGCGKAVWMGSFPLLGCAERYSEKTAQSLLAYMNRAGYAEWETLEVSSGMPQQPRRAPIVRLLRTDDAWIIVLINPMPMDAQVHIRTATSWQGQRELHFALAAGECLWKTYSIGTQKCTEGA
ncbi:MAG: beta-galactosidase [Clostridia bacterium]